MERVKSVGERNEILCTHAGLAYAVLLGGGIFGVAGFLPLISPEIHPQDLLNRFAEDNTRILVGMTILAFGSGFLWLVSSAITTTMKRMESQDSHPLATAQIVAATGSVMVVLFSAYFWIAIGFRGNTSTDAAQIFNDLAFLMFIGAYPPAFIQNIVISRGILKSQAPIELIPKWVGYVTIIVTIINFGGATLCFENENGLFAWNGIFGFWLVAICYFSWFGLMWYQNKRAIKRWYDYKEALKTT